LHDNILTRVYVLFVAILGLIVAVAYFALRTIDRSIAGADWVNHTYATIDEFDSVVSRLRQGEGLIRTYALTGEARDLAAGRAAFARLDQHLENATALTRSDPGPRQALQRLAEQIQAREALAESVSAARGAGQTEKVKALLATDAGSDATAAIERGFGQLREAQFELLSARDHDAYLQAQTTRWVVGTGIALNFFLLVGIGWLLRDDLRARRTATAALETANLQLEARVRERTAELQQANTELRAENLERKWTIASQDHQLRYNQLIVNSVNDLIFVLTKALTVTRINAAVVHLTGRDDAAILTGPFGQVVEVTRGAGIALDPLARALVEGRELRNQPAAVLALGGRRIPALLTLIPLRDQDKVVGAVAIVQAALSADADKPSSP
jgi:CHASE3 domain sensor protein